MEIEFYPEAKADLQFWRESGNEKIQERISALLTSMQQNPFNGIGKPEALKHELSGKWSRRINKEHRIIYKVAEGKIFIYSLKGHY